MNENGGSGRRSAASSALRSDHCESMNRVASCAAAARYKASKRGRSSSNRLCCGEGIRKRLTQLARQDRVIGDRDRRRQHLVRDPEGGDQGRRLPAYLVAEAVDLAGDRLAAIAREPPVLLEEAAVGLHVGQRVEVAQPAQG